MDVLIVEASAPRARIWQRSLERFGARVAVTEGRDAAAEALSRVEFDVIIVNADLEDGSALSVSDLAIYRQPHARIIFVTSTNFFSDGSIFTLCANACAFVPSGTSPEDLACMAAHYARPAQEARAV